MSELRSLFAEQVSGVEAELVGPRLDDAGRARVARGARRGRRIQTIRTSAMATLVVAALGAGGWGLRDLLDRPDIANPPGPTAFTTPSVTPTPSPTPSASVTASASPSASHDWSTVAAGDLPPAFAEADLHQPESRQMQAWVWDYVDDSWTVATYGSGSRGTYLPGIAPGSAPSIEGASNTGVIYLIAPDNTLFHLLDFPKDLVSVSTSHTKDQLVGIEPPRVRLFYPAVRSAEVSLCNGINDFCEGARLDLTSGKFDSGFLETATKAIVGPLLRYEAGATWSVGLLEHRSGGVDAWIAVDYLFSTINVFWGEADGTFRASSISGVVNAKPGVPGGPSWRAFLAPSRNKALFTYDVVSGNGGPVAPPVAAAELYLFDFDGDTARRIDPLLPAAEHCSVTGVIDDTSGVVSCGPASSFIGAGDTSKQKTYRFFFSGVTAPVPYTAQVAEVAWFILQPNRVLPEPKNPNPIPDAYGWVQ